ncbi:MAG: NapC/NirT family cytochrome c, partial [Elusimicrobia bacterium]|nr:NapC/NirT family cytochrome c [Elusimicrobiota bacterium]
MIRRRLPITFYNWTSTVGAFMAVTSFSIIILLFLIDLMVERTTIYLGLLTYVFLPSILVFGLILIAAGALIERRRLAQGKPSFFPKQISVDLTNPVHRDTMVIVAVVGILFLLGTSIGTYKAYQATESVAFCGTLCHRVMNPEHTAYQTSSHARVACVRCHIGPGADWFVKSKLSGLYQVYATLAHKFPQPIPTPIKDLRPARDTCLECHWPEKFFGSRRNVYPHYLADEKNTPNPISLLIHIGGGSEKQGPVEGIHWHMAVSNQVEYIARDKERQEIAWVRVTDKKGNVTEYQHAESPLTPEERGKATVRAMDCIDCHNRPSHVYRSPLRAVNEAMATGDISPTLPYVKREAVKALDSDYADTATAAKEIQAKLLAFYQENHPDVAKDRPADLDAAV